AVTRLVSGTTLFLIYLFDHTTTTEISTLSLHDALPISGLLNTLMHITAPAQLWETGYGRTLIVKLLLVAGVFLVGTVNWRDEQRSEEHTSELQSRENLVCRLLLEKKNK